MRLLTFGGFKLVNPETGEEIEKQPKPKNLLLLAYLAVNGEQRRDKVAELFFGHTDVKEQKPRKNGKEKTEKKKGREPELNSKVNLRKALSEIRKSAPDCVSRGGQEVEFLGTSDIDEFNDLFFVEENVSHDVNLKIANLYLGTFAQGITLHEEADLETWLEKFRIDSASKACKAFIHLGEAHYKKSAKGELDQAAKFAECAFTACKVATTYEIDITAHTKEQLQRIYTLLCNLDSPVANKLLFFATDNGYELNKPDEVTVILNNLPKTRINSFVGRKQELEQIDKQLADENCRLLTLHGMGGIGKSRLAIEAAREQLDSKEFLHGVYFVALETLASADLIPIQIAETLDITLQGTDDILACVNKFISAKKIFMILDNSEHLQGAASIISRILETCPNLKIVVTSREVLNLEEEWVKSIDGLNYPANEDVNIETAEEYDAVELFIERARQSNIDFELNESNVYGVQKICQLVEGTPLAIELVASRIRSISPDTIAKEIEKNLGFLKSKKVNPNKRHQSMLVVLEQSWELLNKKEQDILKKLAIFIGGFSEQGAAQIANANLEDLESFIDKALVRRKGDGKFDFHFLIFEFLSHKFSENKSVYHKTKTLFNNYYFNYLNNYAKSILGKEQQKVLQDIDFERQNVFEALQSIFDEEKTESNCNAINAFCEYLSIRNMASEGITLFEVILQKRSQNKNENLVVTAVLEKCLAWLHIDKGDNQLAQNFAENSLNIIQKTNNVAEYTWILRILYNIYFINSDLEKLKKCLSDLLRISETANDLTSKAITLNNLGVFYTHIGEYKKAEESILESIALDKQYERHYGYAHDLDSLGALYIEIRKFEEAEEAYRESLGYALSMGFKDLQPTLYNGLGRTLYFQGRLDDATKEYDNAFRAATLHKNNSTLLNIHLSYEEFFKQSDLVKSEYHLVTAMNLINNTSLKSQIIECLFKATYYLPQKDNKKVLDIIITDTSTSFHLKSRAKENLEITERQYTKFSDSIAVLYPRLVNLLITVTSTSPT